MPEQIQPNLGKNLVLIHMVISRAIEVTKERIRAFAIADFPDDPMREGFTNYLQCLVSVLRAHHMSEDELAFPFLQERLPDAPFKPLINQHQAVEKFLGQIENGIQRLRTGGDTKTILDVLDQPISRLSVVWYPHIKLEEQHFSAAVLGEVMNPDEHLHLIKAIAEFSQQRSKPDELVIPFILFNLPEEPRSAMSKGMPPELVQKLVPLDWKEQWASMKPFLLD